MIKHFFKFTFGLLAITAVSCSSDDSIPGGEPQKDADVYASLSIKVPAASNRAASAGEEFGQDFENNVGKILIVLATKDADGTYKYLAKAEADGANGSVSENGVVKYILNFKSSQLTPDPLDKDNPAYGNEDVYVFAYCNPTTYLYGLLTNIKKGDDFTDQIGILADKDNATVWTKNQFLMTNCQISAAAKIPNRETLVSQHNTPQKAFNLGTVRVKRVVARFDFATTNNNQYDIKGLDGETSIGAVELTDMAVFNIAGKFYYFPRTNASWNWKGTTTLCGDLEGYVMSFNEGGFKTATSLSSTSYKNHYFANIIGINLQTSTDLDWVSIRPDDWNKKQEDNNNVNGTQWSPDSKDYRIWRYVSENTIPGTESGDVSTQKIGITTGVVFKGEFDPVDKEVWNGNAVYVFNNIFYGDYNALKKYVDENPYTEVASQFKQVEVFKTAPADLKKSLVKGLDESASKGFTAYEPGEGGKYPVYYFYYNRHETNGDNSLLGENEFGVVRNNVYKLAVTSCGRLGKPEAPNKPDNPDEEENAYFIVSCEVMPWTVRVNNIEF